VEQAATGLGFRPDEAFVIGDKPSDIELGKRVGAVTFLVRTGKGTEAGTTPDPMPDYVVQDLLEAAEVIRRLLAVAAR
jgi:D-glycero-D-manno-heptose 1,7-bisphosphate phosphatase